jgi:outer membrane murein-binding lipoprotein Lpp
MAQRQLDFASNELKAQIWAAKMEAEQLKVQLNNKQKTNSV